MTSKIVETWQETGASTVRVSQDEERRIKVKEAKIDNTLKYFLNEIKLLRDDITSIYLFGSRARGDFRPDSDYDLLIVVKQKERGFIDGLYEAVMNTLLREGRLMSLKIFEEKQFEYLTSIPTPFMERVIKGGIKIG